MKKTQKGKMLHFTICNLIRIINQDEYNKSRILADLRKYNERKISNIMFTFGYLIEHIPKEYLSRSGKLTSEERIILDVLQLYSIATQGKVNEQDHNITKSINFGDLVRNFRNSENKNSLDQRFVTLITADSYTELAYHLQQLIKLLKSISNKEFANFDWGKLASDLYYFKVGYKDSIRLNWARCYYKNNHERENIENE